MCGPNEEEIGLRIWKQIGTFCCSNWSRHCINIPQAKYLFSLRCQMEPSVIIVYPQVRISPTGNGEILAVRVDLWLQRPLFGGNLNAQAPPGLLFHWCCGGLCLSGPGSPRPHLHKKSGSLPLEVNTAFFPLFFLFLNCSLLCSENKLPVISLPLKSPALAKMREICLCWAQSSTLQGSAAVWVFPGETVQDGCAIHWWALVQHVRKLELEEFPAHEALISHLPLIELSKIKRRKCILLYIILF